MAGGSGSGDRIRGLQQLQRNRRMHNPNRNRGRSMANRSHNRGTRQGRTGNRGGGKARLKPRGMGGGGGGGGAADPGRGNAEDGARQSRGDAARSMEQLHDANRMAFGARNLDLTQFAQYVGDDFDPLDVYDSYYIEPKEKIDWEMVRAFRNALVHKYRYKKPEFPDKLLNLVRNKHIERQVWVQTLQMTCNNQFASFSQCLQQSNNNIAMCEPALTSLAVCKVRLDSGNSPLLLNDGYHGQIVDLHEQQLLHQLNPMRYPDRNQLVGQQYEQQLSQMEYKEAVNAHEEKKLTPKSFFDIENVPNLFKSSGPFVFSPSNSNHHSQFDRFASKLKEKISSFFTSNTTTLSMPSPPHSSSPPAPLSIQHQSLPSQPHHTQLPATNPPINHFDLPFYRFSQHYNKFGRHYTPTGLPGQQSVSDLPQTEHRRWVLSNLDSHNNHLPKQPPVEKMTTSERIQDMWAKFSFIKR
jgi:hypothetical protein